MEQVTKARGQSGTYNYTIRPLGPGSSCARNDDFDRLVAPVAARVDALAACNASLEPLVRNVVTLRDYDEQRAATPWARPGTAIPRATAHRTRTPSVQLAPADAAAAVRDCLNSKRGDAALDDLSRQHKQPLATAQHAVNGHTCGLGAAFEALWALQPRAPAPYDVTLIGW